MCGINCPLYCSSDILLRKVFSQTLVITSHYFHGGLTMSITWILVANASAAQLYANYGPKKGLQILKEFKHSASRDKGSDLISDRPGQYNGSGNGHGSFMPATDPKQNEARNFALKLAKELDQGRTRNSYQRLILVASAPFMGLINGNLDSNVKILVSDSFEKDYTKSSKKQLTRRLESCIYL